MLEDRGVLSVSGEDATSFLQGLLTNDVERLARRAYAALLTPQGKILFDMIVVRASGREEPSYLIDCTAAQAVDLAKRLGFYKLRAKVAIANQSAERAVAASSKRFRASVKAFSTSTRAIRALGGAPSCRARPLSLSGQSTWPNTKGFASPPGRPRAGSISSPMRTPSQADANFDLLHGVDFDEGCSRRRSSRA